MLDGDALLDIGLMRQNAAEQHGAIQFSEREASLGVSGDRIVVGLVAPSPLCLPLQHSASDRFAPRLSTTPLTGENNTTLPMALTSEQPVKAIAIATPRTPLAASAKGHGPRNDAGRQFGDVEGAQGADHGGNLSSGVQHVEAGSAAGEETIAVTSNGCAVAACWPLGQNRPRPASRTRLYAEDRKDVRMAIVRYLVNDVDAALPFYEALGFTLADRWGHRLRLLNVAICSSGSAVRVPRPQSRCLTARNRSPVAGTASSLSTTISTPH